MPDQSAVEGYLETQRRGYHTTPIPPELRLQQAGWAVRQEWVAEKASQTIRGPSLDYVAGEAYRREDLASEKRARQAERSRIERALKALRDHAEAFENGWESYKANTVEVERHDKIVKLKDGGFLNVKGPPARRSHSKAMKGLDGCQKALRHVRSALSRSCLPPCHIAWVSTVIPMTR